jgi:hypothetical protein
MTRPGYIPFATNDTYVAGPDIGDDTKTAPLTLHREDGYYRTRRPGPDIFNWELNRLGLVQEMVARLQVLNYNLMDSNAFAHTTMDAVCHNRNTTNSDIEVSFFFYSVGAGNVVERRGINGVVWSAPGAVTAAGFAATVAMDAEGSNAYHKVVTFDDGIINDTVRYQAGAGAWATVTFVAGAPALNWRAVGNDRNTAGGANDLWLIGDAASPGPNSALWDSPDGINFTVVATWPAATVQEPLHGIYHSCHAVDALGPDDAGNPTWLVLSDTYATRSTDGATWTAVAHGLNVGGGSFNARSAAYSRPARRWVVVHPDTQFGTISYSDDNGATWTTNAAQLPGASAAAGVTPHIAGDGYGTFVISGNNADMARLWVSTDDGITWTTFEMDLTTIAAGAEGIFPIGCIEEDTNVDEPGLHNQFFCVGFFDAGGPLFEAFRSLVI